MKTALISVGRQLGINNIYSLTKPLIPGKIRNWISENPSLPVVPADDLKQQLQKACKHLASTIGSSAVGDYLEFGVFHGVSLLCMHEVLREQEFHQTRLFGFDSFERRTQVVAVDNKGAGLPVEFVSEYESTCMNLTKHKVDWNKTFLIKGSYPNTLTPRLMNEYKITKASIILIDCDFYSTTKEALNFCIPLIKDTSIIVFDDWSTADDADNNLDEKLAFNEFLAENPQFKAEEFGRYNYHGFPYGQLFNVTNTRQQLNS
ncbi:MAG TPA: class I SAM-dependent methyltransferase [Segetibacter sp.]